MAVGWWFMPQSTVRQLKRRRARLAFPGSLTMHPPGRIGWHRNKQTKTTALIMEWLSFMRAQIRTYTTPEFGAVVPVRGKTGSKRPWSQSDVLFPFIPKVLHKNTPFFYDSLGRISVLMDCLCWPFSSNICMIIYKAITRGSALLDSL